jgi:hypothetical protein
MLCEFLDVLVGQIYAHRINANLLFIPNNVFFLAIVLFTRESSV